MLTGSLKIFHNTQGPKKSCNRGRKWNFFPGTSHNLIILVQDKTSFSTLFAQFYEVRRMNPGLRNIIILQNKQIRMGTLKLSSSNFSVQKDEFIVTHKWVKMIYHCYEVHLYEKQAILRTKLYQKHSTLRNEKSTQPGLAMLRINTIITQPNV